MAGTPAPKPSDMKKIARIVSEGHLERFGSPARVRVEPRHYKDYVDLFVTSPRFRGILIDQRARLVGEWLENGLTRRELVRVASVLPLTPAEVRRVPGLRS